MPTYFLFFYLTAANIYLTFYLAICCHAVGQRQPQGSRADAGGQGRGRRGETDSRRAGQDITATADRTAGERRTQHRQQGTGSPTGRRATRRLDEDEQEKLETTEMAVSSSGHGGARQFTIINEPGLYNAILGSQKPEAKDRDRGQHWQRAIR